MNIMIKKTVTITFTFIVFVLLSSAQPTFAQDSKPTLTPTESAKPIDDTIKSIKEKIENKVEEINKESKKVIIGTFDKLADNVIELNDEAGKGFKISIDDTVTSFFSVTTKKSTEIKSDNLEKGDRLIVFGPIIEDQMSANKVIRQSHYVAVQGEITSLDKDNFTIDIVTSNRDELSIDVEDATSQRLLDIKDLTFSKAGFSKYKIGDHVHVVYIKGSKEGEKVTAIRILILPQEYFTDTSPSPSPKENE